MWFRDLPWLLHSVPKEPEMNRLFEELCATFQPGIFWDVGANIGWFSWLVNARSNLSRALLVEPLPLNAALLNETLTANHLSHFRVVKSAVADRCGEFRFLADHKSGATSQLKEIYAEGDESAIAQTYGLTEEISVECTTLDDLIAGGEAIPDLMKIDVEDAEVLALRGAEGLIKEGRTIIVLECHRHEAIDILLSRGYEVFTVDACANFLAVPEWARKQAEAITRSMQKVLRKPQI